MPQFTSPTNTSREIISIRNISKRTLNEVIYFLLCGLTHVFPVGAIYLRNMPGKPPPMQAIIFWNLPVGLKVFP